MNCSDWVDVMSRQEQRSPHTEERRGYTSKFNNLIVSKAILTSVQKYWPVSCEYSNWHYYGFTNQLATRRKSWICACHEVNQICIKLINWTSCFQFWMDWYTLPQNGLCPAEFAFQFQKTLPQVCNGLWYFRIQPHILCTTLHWNPVSQEIMQMHFVKSSLSPSLIFCKICPRSRGWENIRSGLRDLKIEWECS